MAKVENPHVVFVTIKRDKVIINGINKNINKKIAAKFQKICQGHIMYVDKFLYQSEKL